MEELLKVMYRNYIEENDGYNPQYSEMSNNALTKVYKVLDKIGEVLKEDLYEDMRSEIIEGITDIQQMYFIVGFNQCSKMLTNGKIDFLAK